MSYEEQMRKNERALVLGDVMGCEKAGVAQEPNALQEENDRLKEEVAMLEGQLRQAWRREGMQEGLIMDLRAALVEACDWDWMDHKARFIAPFVETLERVPAPICKQIFEALHRKV